MITSIHDKLKTLGNGAKDLAKYLTKPYYSFAKNDFDDSDSGNYFAPMVRNLMGAAIIGTACYIMSGKLPEIPISKGGSILLLDTLLEGTAITIVTSAVKKIKNRQILNS